MASYIVFCPCSIVCMAPTLSFSTLTSAKCCRRKDPSKDALSVAYSLSFILTIGSAERHRSSRPTVKVTGSGACHTTARMCQCSHAMPAQTDRNGLSQATQHSVDAPGRSPQPGSASSAQPLHLPRSTKEKGSCDGSTTPPLRAHATTTTPPKLRIP